MKSKFDEYVNMGLLRSQHDITGKLTVYQYTELVQFDRLWNSVTLNARGIVFDENGRVVQRCMPKFFNSDEPNGIIDALVNKAGEPTVQDKLDGSLIKVSQDDQYGLVVTSKASFASLQAKWAIEIIEQNNYKFLAGYTYHFELIHPENQIVLNYGNKKELVLLSIIENETGNEVNIYSHPMTNGFELVELLSPEVIADVNLLNMTGLKEGIVVNYGTYRVKMKTDEYVRLHRIVTDFTPKRVWEALSEGQVIDRLNVPEEFLKWLDETEAEIKNAYHILRESARYEYEQTIDMTPKEIGLSELLIYKPFIFALRSGKDITPMLWKAVKPKSSQ